MCKFKKLTSLLALMLLVFIIPTYMSAKNTKKPIDHSQNNIILKRQRRRQRHKQLQKLKATRFHRNTYGQPIIDLRGLNRKDAASLVQSIASNSLENLTFITGDGKYSSDGQSVLKQTVLEVAERIKWTFVPHNYNKGRVFLICPDKLKDSELLHIKPTFSPLFTS